MSAESTAAGEPRAPHRWRLHRAGIVNVWRYYDNEFRLSGGRMVLRGTNGSGKSRALEMLLPYLLDADRAKMDATGSRKVQLQDLMRVGAEGASNRLGYLWLELSTGEETDPDRDPEFLTLGALVRWSASTGEAKTWFFTTPLRVGQGLPLLDADRQPLSREDLTALIGADRLTDSPESHRETVRRTVFGLTDDTGRDRFAGLVQLLHTLRAPDVGNRIEEGQLPVLLSDALPPLSDRALSTAGSQLDALSETRAAQERLEQVHDHVLGFLGVYRRYATSALLQRAEDAREASRRLRSSTRSLTEAERTRDELATQENRAQEAVRVLEEGIESLRQRISGLEQSDAYRSAQDLVDRERTVEAQAGTARGALRAASTARRVEDDAARTVRSVAEKAAVAGRSATSETGRARTALHDAGLPDLPLPPIDVTTVSTDAVTALVRTTLGVDPEPLPRPAVTTLVTLPAHLDSAAPPLAAAARAASDRGDVGEARRRDAVELERQAAAVLAEERRAHDADARADGAATTAVGARDDRDERGRALARAWTAWVHAPETVELLGPVGGRSVPLDAVLADPEGLVGDSTDDAVPLDDLDGAAAVLVREPHDAATARRFALEAAATADAATVADLRDERDRLAAAQDSPPERPSWQRAEVAGPGSGVPFWRAVDFGDDVSDADRNGVESALSAAGLLTATIHPDASVRAADGELLVSPGPATTGSSTSAERFLKAEPGPLADIVAAVLATLGTAPGAAAWVGSDGSFGLGPLRGRAVTVPARHIGTRAREAARRRRLAEIDTALTALADAAERRERELAEVAARRRALDDLVRRAPRSGPLRQAVERARTLTEVAAAARVTAVHLLDEAAAARRAHQQADGDHRAKCRRVGLPVTAVDLGTTVKQCRDAARRCTDLVQGVQALLTVCAEHASAVEQWAVRGRERDEAEQQASQAHDAWGAADAALVALRDSVGAEVEAVQRDILTSTQQLQTAKSQVVTAAAAARDVVERLGSARTSAEVAAERQIGAQDGLRAAAADLQRRTALPGLLAAAGRDVTLHLALDPVTPTTVDAAVTALREALSDPDAHADENQLARALQNLQRELVGSYDVTEDVRDGVRIVHLADAEGSATLADAAATLERRREQGAGALSARERQVFADFVLGGVAEELRQRIARAEDLVAAMNSSLSSLTTSHGIGVRLRWSLQDGADTPVVRIKELVTRSGIMRPAAESEELSHLLENLVDAEFAGDPGAGYTTHLRSALDYRRWHTVDVIITGPERGQERRISRRAKLSQGETRFVSYVTLFAAADAYLSGLPDTSRALRLVLLDDAFAKVDDGTIGELLGLLVQLDLDFVMTGHALWGFYPQVPSLDAYEVRRGDGTAAVTTRVHWDGTTRHLGLE